MNKFNLNDLVSKEKQGKCLGVFPGQAAFTLAEVLITLGIIGVVAAMTIPILIQNYRNITVETKLKKFYSTINQAIKLSEEENESGENWVNQLNTMEGMQKYILPYFKTMKVEEDENDIYMYLADGSIVIKNKIGNMYGWDLITGNFKDCKNLSHNGICRFSFYYKPFNNTSQTYLSKTTKLVEPYDLDADLWANRGHISSIEFMKTNASNGCNNLATSTNGYCTKLIQLNGWKIPYDYPHKVR